jgi:hypothetical protein
MLQKHTINESLLTMAVEMKKSDVFKDFILAGGTALSL